MNLKLIIYISIFVVVSIILLITIQVIYKRALKKRTKVIDRLKVSEVSHNTRRFGIPLKSFKTRAKEGVTTRFSIFRKVATFIVFLIFIIAVTFPFIDQLPQAFISILVGSAAIITGMSAKPFIENFLAGIAITSSKMMNIGDTIIINDNYGTIEDISATHTVLKLWDWRRFIIPNSTMINKEFVNLTLNDKLQWAYVEFFVSYDSDIELVKKIAEDAARSSSHKMEIEEPSFWIMDTTKDSIKCWIAAWASSPLTAWGLKSDIRTTLVIGLKKAGITTNINYHSMNSTTD